MQQSLFKQAEDPIDLWDNYTHYYIASETTPDEMPSLTKVIVGRFGEYARVKEVNYSHKKMQSLGYTENLLTPEEHTQLLDELEVRKTKAQ